MLITKIYIKYIQYCFKTLFIVIKLFFQVLPY